MNQLLLSPNDVLFFRDGRPMSGSLSGHGNAWPLPTVTNAALHAALWRAGETFAKVRAHRRGRSGSYDDSHCDRRFGSLVTAGPFPVIKQKGNAEEWLFPRPLDAGIRKQEGKPEQEVHEATLLPLPETFDSTDCSLPQFLKYAVTNCYEPTKKTPSAWWNKAGWEHYLGTGNRDENPRCFKDSEFADAESRYGIGIDDATGTQDGESFYSAHFLRLKPDCHIGLFATAPDRINNEPPETRDLIPILFPNSGTKTPVIVGGQQRLCSVQRCNPESLHLPHGMSAGFEQEDPQGKSTWHVKWILLSPAVFPEIASGRSKRGTERKAHPGGWLPTWICPDTGKVLLETIDAAKRKKRRNLNAQGIGYESHPNIDAQLVASIVGKPIPVTGYALPHETTGEKAGPKPTQLAVPAGSVYYFECADESSAQKLAAALNWHGTDDFSTIRNRRSTLMGEKGFGLGVCSTWAFHVDKIPS